MKFISTNSGSAPVGIDEAVNRCVASDGGMFMPERIPIIPQAFFRNIGSMNLREIAYVVASSFLGDDVPSAELKNITDLSFSFEVPLKRLEDNIYVLELFNGPTLTFKDFGARFMARLMRHLDGKASRRRNVLVATTGNTGAAAANGLFKLKGISVSVLYPRGQLSKTQTSQITALGENIHPIEVAGSVEDCKRLVQSAIADPSLAKYNLTGANSINIARLIPQVTFALYGYSRLVAAGVRDAEKALYSIPSGNLSNVVAAAMALKTGLPAGGLIAAVNANNQFAACLTGNMPATRPKPVRTLAPSMDMSVPSGFPRLAYLYDSNMDALRRDVLAAAPVSDEKIASAIRELYHTAGYALDPHGAVAYVAAKENGDTGVPKVVFATGHPAKQLDTMTRITGSALEMPHQLSNFMTVRRHPAVLPPTLPALKKMLLSFQ